jgi:hypothetical protein
LFFFLSLRVAGVVVDGDLAVAVVGYPEQGKKKRTRVEMVM